MLWKLNSNYSTSRRAWNKLSFQTTAAHLAAAYDASSMKIALRLGVRTNLAADMMRRGRQRKEETREWRLELTARRSPSLILYTKDYESARHILEAFRCIKLVYSHHESYAHGAFFH